MEKTIIRKYGGKKLMKSNLRNEIKSYIVRQGMTMQEVVDLLRDEHGWSDSVSNLSNKLQRESFKQLFGGGHGSLELVEDEDILECGIRIVAQPPGKKLQNMMQMAGGEKALTAIALLFAIQALKPSPFCLLDEIEAALDVATTIAFNRQ